MALLCDFLQDLLWSLTPWLTKPAGIGVNRSTHRNHLSKSSINSPMHHGDNLRRIWVHQASYTNPPITLLAFSVCTSQATGLLSQVFTVAVRMLKFWLLSASGATHPLNAERLQACTIFQAGCCCFVKEICTGITQHLPYNWSLINKKPQILGVEALTNVSSLLGQVWANYGAARLLCLEDICVTRLPQQ